MNKEAKPAQSGIAGVLFVCCAAACAAGIAADFLSNDEVAFWLGAQDGGAAAIGAGVAAFAAASAYVANAVLTRGGRGAGKKGGRHADTDA